MLRVKTVEIFKMLWKKIPATTETPLLSLFICFCIIIQVCNRILVSLTIFTIPASISNVHLWQKWKFIGLQLFQDSLLGKSWKFLGLKLDSWSAIVMLHALALFLGYHQVSQQLLKGSMQLHTFVATDIVFS